jgi:hypothetical protein
LFGREADRWQRFVESSVQPYALGSGLCFEAADAGFYDAVQRCLA